MSNFFLNLKKSYPGELFAVSKFTSPPSVVKKSRHGCRYFTLWMSLAPAAFIRTYLVQKWKGNIRLSLLALHGRLLDLVWQQVGLNHALVPHVHVHDDLQLLGLPTSGVSQSSLCWTVLQRFVDITSMFFTLKPCFVLLITMLGNLVLSHPLATFLVALLLVLHMTR